MGSDDERAARLGGWQRCLLLVCAAIRAPAASKLHVCVCVLYSALTLQVASELSVIARPLHGWSGESFFHAAALSSCREPAKSARRLGNQTSLPLSR